MLANVTAPMSTEEAQSWEREVGQSVNHLRQLLWTGYQREVWHSLGYESWTDCLHALAHKYGFSERHAWRLHSANSTEDLLTPGSVGDIPEKHLRPLTGLTPEQQREAWEEAVATAPDGNVTGRHVQDVVARLSGNGNGHQHSGLAEFERGYQREVEAEREHPCVRCGEIYPEYELIEEPDGVWFCEDCYADAQAINDDLPAPKPHVSHNSGEEEWYTPPEIIEAARTVMGRIDLDPASCEAANEIVQADRFFSREDDGLAQRWCDWHEGQPRMVCLWMNPPYTRGVIDQFAAKLTAAIDVRDIEQACVLVNNATETEWFQALLEYATAICFIAGRLKYVNADGEAKGKPLQGQVVLYFGIDTDAFKQTFGAFGAIWGPGA